MMKRIVIAGFTLGLLVGMTAVAQSDSSLVQASKQKSTDKKAKRVFTNDDYPEKPELSPAPAGPAGAVISDAKGGAAKDGPVAVADGKPADEKTADGKPADAKADDKKPEVKETKQAELERKLDTSKREEQDLRQKLAKLQEKANNETDENRRGMYFDIISNQQTTLSEYRRNQEELQKQIEDEKSKKSE
jgi:hypothetical protein